MPTATNDGVDLYYETAGEGPTVALVSPVGFGAWCWSWLVEGLTGPLETLVWDLRGTGNADAPPGPYDVETMASDLEAVLAAHGAGSVHLVGAGLGGMIALQYAREHGRARTLTLLGTAADGRRVDRPVLDSLAAPTDDIAALRDGLAAAFSDGVVDEHPDVMDRIVAWRRADDAPLESFDDQADAMCEFDATDWLHEITLPALICHGERDAVIPVAAGRDLADGLPRGEFRGIDAGHLVAVEEPAAVEDALADFLADAGGLDR